MGFKTHWSQDPRKSELLRVNCDGESGMLKIAFMGRGMVIIIKRSKDYGSKQLG